jgi:hypothetical protein
MPVLAQDCPITACKRCSCRNWSGPLPYSSGHYSQTKGTYRVTILDSQYIHTYLHTYILTFLHSYILTYLHTYILTYLHTYIRTYIHTHTYIYIIYYYLLLLLPYYYHYCYSLIIIIIIIIIVIIVYHLLWLLCLWWFLYPNPKICRLFPIETKFHGFNPIANVKSIQETKYPHSLEISPLTYHNIPTCWTTLSSYMSMAI